MTAVLPPTTPDASSMFASALPHSYSAYLGTPNENPTSEQIVRAQRTGVGTTTYNEADRFNGSQLMLGDSVLDAAMTYAEFTGAFLPPVESQDEGRVAWNVSHFARTLTAPLAYQAPPRQTTSARWTESAELGRLGLMMASELHYFQTPEGKEDWISKLAQLTNAIRTTAHVDCLATLFTTPNYRMTLVARGIAPLPKFKERSEYENNAMACVQKSAGGLTSAISSLLDSAQSQHNVNVDGVIVPSEVLPSFADRIRARYPITRPDEAGNLITADGPMAETIVFNGVFVFASRSITLDTSPGPIDPLRSVVAYGEVYRAFDLFQGISTGYSSRFRDISLFSMAKGANHAISFLDIMKNAIGRFNPADGKLSGLHKQLAAAINSGDSNNGLRDATNAAIRSRKIRGKPMDVFIYCTNPEARGDDRRYAKTKVIGQMEEGVYSSTALVLNANTVLANIENSVGPEMMRLLSVERLDDLTAALAPGGGNRDVLTAFTRLHSQLTARFGQGVIGDLGAFSDKYAAETFSDAIALWDPSTSTTPGKLMGSRRANIQKHADDDRNLRAIALAIAMSPVSLDTFERFFIRDVPIPLSGLLMRPSITHEFYSIIGAVMGLRTGAFLHGAASYLVQTDHMTRMIYGTLAYIAKAVVYTPKNVSIAPHSYLIRYIGGQGHNFVRNVNEWWFGQPSAQAGVARDIIASLEPYTIDPDYSQTMLDLTGRFNMANIDIADIDGVPVGEDLHYVGAIFMDAALNFSSSVADANKTDYAIQAQRTLANTVCRDGPYNMYNITTDALNTPVYGHSPLGPYGNLPSAVSVRNGAVRGGVFPMGDPRDNAVAPF